MGYDGVVSGAWPTRPGLEKGKLSVHRTASGGVLYFIIGGNLFAAGRGSAWWCNTET